MNTLLQYFKSPKIFVIAIFWLMILVVLGTLSQRDMGLFFAQKKYFSSYIIWFNNFLPLPGSRSALIIIFINLLFLSSNKNIWKIKKVGILIVHFGAVLLLLGGGLTAIFSSEGTMIINEGSSSNFMESYHDMEFALIDKSNDDFDEYFIIDQAALFKGNIINYEDFNFEIEIIKLLENCEPIRRTTIPGFQNKGLLKNFILNEINVDKEGSRNTPGLIIKIRNSDSNINGLYGFFLNQTLNQTILSSNKKFELVFRKKRTYLPFILELLDFKKVLHPGTGIAKSYSSNINLIENDIPRRVLIKMNEPLRHRGITFYQSSFIEGSNGDTTILAVVKNYGRLFPYISSIIMSIGLLIHLLFKLPKLINKK